MTAISGFSLTSAIALAVVRPDDHAADQPGPGGGGDAVEAGEAAPGLLHRLGDDQVERLDMGARRDLRHHAAEGGVLVDLRQHHVGQDPAAPVVRSRSTTAAAVSSQVVSMPSTTIADLIPRALD